MSTLTFQQYDASKVVFDKLMDYGKSGGKICFLKYQDGGKPQVVSVKSPEVYLPYGPSVYQDNWAKVKLHIGLDSEKDASCDNMVAQLEALKKRVVQKIMEDKEWQKLMGFKKKPVEAVVESKVGEFVRVPDNEKYKPSMVLTLRNTQDKTEHYKVKIQDSERGEYEPTRQTLEEHLSKGSSVKVIFKVESIWFVSGKCGLTIKAEHIMFKKRETTGSAGFDESDFMGSASGQTTMAQALEEVTTEKTVDSDEDFDEDE